MGGEAMTDDGIEFNPNRSEDFIPGVPKPRKPERVGKPRRSTEADLKAAMERICDEIAERGRKRGYREFQ